jgi:hypothetical protein
MLAAAEAVAVAHKGLLGLAAVVLVYQVVALLIMELLIPVEGAVELTP